MRESLLIVSEQSGHRTLGLLPIYSEAETRRRPVFGLQMQRLDGDCALRLVRLDDFKTEGARSLTDGPVAGCLGIMRREGEDFIAVVTRCSLVCDLMAAAGRAEDSRRIYRIDRVAFYAIGTGRWDGWSETGAVDAASGNGPGGAFEDLPVGDQLQAAQHPMAEVAAYLSSGYFYFSYDHDLTQSVQRDAQDVVNSWRTCSATFFWNGFLLEPVREFAEGLPREHLDFIEHGGLFLVAMQGFVQSAAISPSVYEQEESKLISVAVISRLSCHRAGTRFRSRGIDDDGHVANFVESEVIIATGTLLFSYIILRGSVPVFWDQQGLQFGRPSFQITRSAAATQPAFDRHFDRLIRQYGLVHCVDLLGQKVGSAEQLLSAAYKLHADRYPSPSDSQPLTLTQFDVNAVCKNEDLSRVSTILHWLGQDVQLFSFFLSDNGEPVRTQRGIFRVNCQDCLDRTNLVQGFIVRTVVDFFLHNHISESVQMDSILGNLNQMWANNGDALSMIYTGTGALRSGYTRTGRRTLAGLMDDVRKTAQRFYVNNFQDRSRQLAVDMLLGKLADQEPVTVFNPISRAVAVELTERLEEYSDKEKMLLLAVTWNCGGAVPNTADTDMLRDLVAFHDHPPELVAVSFQEIVELSATQIMSVDPERRLEWEAFIQGLLNVDGEEEFSLLVSNQLVGTTLSLWVNRRLLPDIRGVEIASLKTGFGGMTGNKGSVAIRLNIRDTSICLIASHFTAGQAYAMERNREWQYIQSSLQFSRARGIDGHDVVVWMGDLNYRVEMDPDLVRFLLSDASDSTLSRLLETDQLRRSMALNMVFHGYQEGELSFLPTYKYDRFADTFDSSEKNRTPSYTDRILCKGAIDGILEYRSCQKINLSDHRPVCSLMSATIRRIDKSRLDSLQGELFAKYISASPVIQPPPLPTRNRTVMADHSDAAATEYYPADTVSSPPSSPRASELSSEVFLDTMESAGSAEVLETLEALQRLGLADNIVDDYDDNIHVGAETDEPTVEKVVPDDHVTTRIPEDSVSDDGETLTTVHIHEQKEEEVPVKGSDGIPMGGSDKVPVEERDENLMEESPFERDQVLKELKDDEIPASFQTKAEDVESDSGLSIRDRIRLLQSSASRVHHDHDHDEIRTSSRVMQMVERTEATGGESPLSREASKSPKPVAHPVKPGADTFQ